MRVYMLPVTVPPNTPRTAPLQQINSLGGRRIEYGEIIFPDGPLGLTGVRLLDNGKQISPLPSGAWLTGNNRAISFIRNYVMEGPPYMFMIEAYNDADDWPHTPVIRLEVD